MQQAASYQPPGRGHAVSIIHVVETNFQRGSEGATTNRRWRWCDIKSEPQERRCPTPGRERGNDLRKPVRLHRFSEVDLESLRSNPRPISSHTARAPAHGAWWHLPAQFALVTGVMAVTVGIALIFGIPIGIGALLAGMLAVLRCLR